MLKKTEPIQRINGSTKVYGIIGVPLEDSLSPVFWNRAFGVKGINASYLPFPTGLAELAPALSGLKACGVCGVNVTTPLKTEAASLCQQLHGAAHDLGAINTIRFNKQLEGWNTDATGLQRVLARFEPDKKRILVMGNGASAGSAAWALQNIGAKHIKIIARNPDRANKFLKASDLIKKLAWENKNLAMAIRESDIIINTTPLGRKKEDFVVELKECLDQNKVYVDLNYVPFSRLLLSASESGCKVVDGRELLLQQGLESFRILMQTEPPEEIMRESIFG